MMPSAFGQGFSPDFGFNGVGQLLLITGTHPTYEDGDILVAKNRRAIRCVHAEHICHPRINGRKVGGRLGASQPLLEILYSNVYQYRFERVSPTEIKRIDLATMDEEIIGPTPNANGEHMAVEEYVAKRVAAGKKPLFGSEGAEVWYGGRTDASHAKLDTVWQEIEARTANREVDHVHWPFTDTELRGFLAISVDDFDDQTSGDLTSSLVDAADPDNPVMIKKRKHTIHWRGLRDVVEADVLNRNLPIDIRGIRKHVRAAIVQAKML